MENDGIRILESGYSKGRSDVPTLAQYRTAKSITELVSYCDSNSHIHVLDRAGKVRIAKVNGKVRTWKRDASRVEIPCKYGMYEFFTLTASDIESVLIPV